MEIVKVLLSSILSVGALFFIAKLMGHKEVGQLDFFDYISGITIGSIAAELATELDAPWKPLIAMAVYGGVSILLSVLTQRLPRSRKYLNGTPTIIMSGGKIYKENMKKAKLDLSEFMIMCREKGFFDLSEIEMAVFEHNGRLTILPRSDKRPLTPSDINLSPKPAFISAEVVMDGEILGENLKRMGLDEVWLMRQIKEKGYGSAKEIFLGVCDKEKKLTLYPKDIC